jgi:hypothetical protein
LTQSLRGGAVGFIPAELALIAAGVLVATVVAVTAWSVRRKRQGDE